VLVIIRPLSLQPHAQLSLPVSPLSDCSIPMPHPLRSHASLMTSYATHLEYYHVCLLVSPTSQPVQALEVYAATHIHDPDMAAALQPVRLGCMSVWEARRVHQVHNAFCYLRS